MKKKRIFKHFQFVFENVDTISEVGKRILPILKSLDGDGITSVPLLMITAGILFTGSYAVP